jgi:replicative superfamily II helicase
MARTIEIEQVVADPTLNICLDTLKKEKQGLVFCNTKRGAESQAEKIAAKVKQESAALLNLGRESAEDIAESDKAVQASRSLFEERDCLSPCGSA